MTNFGNAFGFLNEYLEVEIISKNVQKYFTAICNRIMNKMFAYAIL